MTREEIFDLIEEENVEFIRLQFADVFGHLKNIAVTPSQLERVMDYMYPFDGSAIFGEWHAYTGSLYLYPDIDTFVILPWRPQQGKVAKIICDVCTEDGRLSPFSSRTILKNVIEEAKSLGYTFKINPECEFFLFHTDDNGNATTISHEKAGYLDVGPADFGENARREMVLTLEEMGFEIESSHHEKAPAQHEIDFTEGETLKIADDIVTFRFAVRSIAKRFGLYATFMPKPISGVAGSGMHLNFVLQKDGKYVFEDKDGKMSEEARFFIGGILSHAEGLALITNPLVNSYKRLMSGFEAPRAINWSTEGEDCLVRFHESFGERKVELRFPDSAANPYTSLAVCIATGLDGIKNKIDPDKLPKNKLLPGNLKDAIRHFKKDELIRNTLGLDYSKVFSEINEEAWNEYMVQVSDWEVNRYLTKM